MFSFINILRWVLRVVSLACIATSLLLIKQGMDRFKAGSDLYPAGSVIAGIPVGGLDAEQAGQRLEQAYAVPVDLRCSGSVFQAAPADLGFSLDLDGMLSAASQEQTVFSWQAYWDYLNGSTYPAVHIPLRSSVDDARLRAYLSTQVAPRCGVPATQAAPYPGMLDFIPGQSGKALDVENSVGLIQKAVISLDQRSADLPTTSLPPLPASIQNLEIFLKQTIRLSNYDGVAGVFLSDLQSNREFTFVLNHGAEVDKPESVSFTGASTIKIPIMIAVMRRVP